MYAYDTLSAAITGLRERGYSLDFNLTENCVVCGDVKFHPEDFEIAEVYRFEGNTDPGDEEVVYGIFGKDGKKGILVNGYGPSADLMTAEMAKKFRMHTES
jgi:hypothetical protein